MFTHPHSCGHARAHRIARLLICLVAVTATSATVALSAGAAAADPAPPAQNCPRWTAVLLPGTPAREPDATSDQRAGTLTPIEQGLRTRYGTDIDIRTLNATTPDSNPEPVGAQALRSTLAGLCSTTRVVLAGYSRGADTLGTVATAIGSNHGPLPASRVAAVALLSDPHRNPATPQLGNTVPGQGIAGPRPTGFGTLAGRVHTACTPNDLTCSTPPQAAPALTALGTALTEQPTPSTTDTLDATPTTTPAPTTSTAPAPNSTPAASEDPGQLDPATVIDQVVTVLSGLTGFAADVPAIVGDLAQLPGLITTGNIPGLHHLAEDLNTQFSPLVQTAADIDLHLVAQALQMAAPLDTSGWTAIAAQIVSILANLDINRIATDIGQAQEIAWGAVQKLTTGDPAGAAATLAGLAPIAGDLAVTAASALTGDAGTALSGLARTFTATTTPTINTALTDLTHRNNDATPSTAPAAPQAPDYSSATGPALHWLTNRIGHTA